MNRLGLFLITAGTIVGTLAACLDPKTVAWSLYVPGFIAGAIGVALCQWAKKKSASDESTVAGNVQVIEASLGALTSGLTRLCQEKSEATLYDLPDAIDTTLVPEFLRFAEARESLIPRYGIAAYADIMSHFAAGERYLNRVWSAAAEGYIDEAHTFLEKSRAQLAQCQEKLQAARTEASHPGTRD